MTKQNFYITINSVVNGLTLDKWVTDDLQNTKETYVDSYLTLGEAVSTTLGGLPAKEVTASEKSSGKWVTYDSVYIINGKLKYELDFVYPKDAPAADIQAKKDILFKSFTFTNKINSTIGVIADENENKTNKSKIVNKSLGLNLELPAYWKDATPSSSKSYTMKYDFYGGSFSIISGEKPEAEIAKTMEENLRKNSAFTVTTASDTTVAGLSARKLVYNGDEFGATATAIVYIFGNSTKSYVLIYGIGDAFATPTALQRVEDVVASIQVTP
ncbi:MAG: hypothetical protein JWM44_1952 [Bacilli bacterium]|nr:hypothetical protein [Bacilli bacterium]